LGVEVEDACFDADLDDPFADPLELELEDDDAAEEPFEDPLALLLLLLLEVVLEARQSLARWPFRPHRKHDLPSSTRSTSIASTSAEKLRL
jgi:hypothetical protein